MSQKPDAKRSKAFTVFLFFTLLGVVYSWPLIINVTDGIPYTYKPDPVYQTVRMFHGDHLQAYYHIGLLKKAATGAIDWFSNPYEFATESQPPMFTTYFLPVTIFYLPFSFISETVAYNILTWLSFGLAGLAGYLWVAQLTGSRTAGLMGGILLNFLPLRLVELYGGHPSGHAVFYFPLALYFFDRAVKTRSLMSGVFGGLTIIGFTYQYPYFVYYLFMFLMVYIPWRLGPEIFSMVREGKTGFARLKELVVVGIPFAIGALTSVWVMLSYKKAVVSKSSFAAGRTMGEVSLFSPDLSAVVIPDPGHTVYFGIATLIPLVALALVFFVKRAEEPNKADITLFTVIFIVTYILAFGTTLNSYIPLYSLFYEHFPYFNFSRNPTKIMIVTAVSLSALGGYVTAWALRRKTGKVGVTIILLVSMLAVMIDYHPKQAIGITLLDKENRVYTRLAKVAGEKKSINIPLWPGESAWSSIYQYYALLSKTAMINGYSPIVSQTYIDEIFWPLFTLNSGDISKEQATMLRGLNVGYLLFHEEAYPPKVSAYSPQLALRRLLRSPYLELVDKEEPIWLFAVRKEPGDGEPSTLTMPGGFLFQSEYLPRIKGGLVEDGEAYNGLALAGASGVEDFLNAGPYKTFPAGRYKATFRIRTGAKPVEGDLLVIDVAGEGGSNVRALRVITSADFPVPGRYEEFTLGYDLSVGIPWQVEFRAKSTGRSDIFIDSVYVRFADQVDPLFTVEAEDLNYTGTIRSHGSVEGGKAVFSTPDRDPSTLMVYGPGRILPAGSYTAYFRMKTEASMATPNAVADVEIYSENLGRNLATRTVTGEETGSVYTDVTVPFAIEKPDAVDFKVIFKGSAPLWVDRITVAKVAGE